jgi:hypothetical protein
LYSEHYLKYDHAYARHVCLNQQSGRIAKCGVLQNRHIPVQGVQQARNSNEAHEQDYKRHHDQTKHYAKLCQKE